MLNSNRKYSIAIAYSNTNKSITNHIIDVNELLATELDDNSEVTYSCQEYTDDILDLSIGQSMYLPMRDNCGDILIKRLK